MSELENLSFQKRYALALESMNNPLKNTTNDYYGSNYATLDQVLRIVKPALAEYGFVLLQSIRRDFKDEWCLVTEIMDTMETEINPITQLDIPPIPMNGKAQARGSEQTYERRYALMMIFGLAPVDDDGNACSVLEIREGKKQKQEMDNIYSDLADVCNSYAVMFGHDVNALKGSVWKELRGKPAPAWIERINAMKQEVVTASKDRVQEIS